jgi:NAD(P)-dependent dehydrogenase (short-subunit alcohol dehydrogenase family)
MSAERVLAGRHAVVTGGGRGIGAAIATALARMGADLTLMGRDEGRLKAHGAALALAHGVHVTLARCDVADAASVAAAFAESRAERGEPYILVNNAGQAAAGRLVETSRALWDRLLAVNLTGPFLCMQQVLPGMLEARAGRIVNVGSVSSLRGYQNVAAYTASKHGLIGLTRAAAAETAKRGITVNAVCPAFTDTEMAQIAVDNLQQAGRTQDEAMKMLLRVIPRGTLITPDEVAATVAWLCAPEAAAISGQAILLAGGEP